MKDYSPEELTESNGRDGKPALVAANGKVYDVSASRRWPAGFHMKRHRAGNDLTADLQAAPHGTEVLERFPQVGNLKSAEKQSPGLKGKVLAWTDAHPFFRRHPHPAIVHVPVGLFSVVPLLLVAYLITDYGPFESSALICQVIALAAMPAAMISGYLTWWLNYDAKDSDLIRTKRRLAWSGLVFGVIILFLRLCTGPSPAASVPGSMYLLGTLILSSIVGYIGYLGGKLTFPYESPKKK